MRTQIPGFNESCMKIKEELLKKGLKPRSDMETENCKFYLSNLTGEKSLQLNIGAGDYHTQNVSFKVTKWLRNNREVNSKTLQFDFVEKSPDHVGWLEWNEKKPSTTKFSTEFELANMLFSKIVSL